MAMIFRRLRHVTMLVAFFAPSLCHSQTTEPQKLVTIQEYISANSSSLSDPPTFQYVLVRCTALYNALSARFNRETAPGRLAIQSQLNSKAADFFSYSFNLEKTQLDNKGDNIANMKANIIKLAVIYDANMSDASLRLGSFWNNEIVKSDYDTCEGLLTYVKSRSK